MEMNEKGKKRDATDRFSRHTHIHARGTAAVIPRIHIATLFRLFLFDVSVCFAGLSCDLTATYRLTISVARAQIEHDK